MNEEKRIDKMAETDVGLRIHPPDNPHRGTADTVREEVFRIASDLTVVGYHCTRLHESEVASILTRGAEPSSVDLLYRRINARVEDGSLPPEVAELLLSENNCGDSNRCGRIWFVFNQSLLKDEGGIGRFFRYWGGEALYRLHQNNPLTTPYLERIGEPCIIEAAIPVTAIASCWTQIGERLLNGYLRRRKVRTENGDDVEGFVRQAVPASLIRRVIRRTDADFDLLTGYTRWRMHKESAG